MARFEVLSSIDPLLRISLEPGESVAAESNAMVAMDGSISLKGETRGGFFKSLARKFLNDENFFQQSFVADDEPGSVLLAPNLPGDVVLLDVGERQYMLSDGAFLAATDGVELETKTQSLGRALLGNSGGLFLMATQGRGQIALSGFGSIQAVDVKPGQKLIVDNGHLVAWDRELDYELSINTARSGLLGTKARCGCVRATRAASSPGSSRRCRRKRPSRTADATSFPQLRGRLRAPFSFQRSYSPSPQGKGADSMPAPG